VAYRCRKKDEVIGMVAIGDEEKCDFTVSEKGYEKVCSVAKVKES
jgi:hypothetical protein